MNSYGKDWKEKAIAYYLEKGCTREFAEKDLSDLTVREEVLLRMIFSPVDCDLEELERVIIEERRRD